MWRGFLIESKSYMSYDSGGLLDKALFWIQYPIACFRYRRSMRGVE